MALRSQLFSLFVLLAAACGDARTLPPLPQNPLDVQVGADGFVDLGLTGGKIGDACTGETPCRPGLRCEESTCVPKGDVPEGGSCIASAECDAGLLCGLDAQCRPEGEGGLGHVCSSPHDCTKELYCKYLGVVGVCSEAGASDVTQDCEATAGCQAGLVCDQVDGTCAAPLQILATYATPPACEAEKEGAKPTALFRVPRAGAETSEFYSLPFPNDIRNKGGRIDLAGHPTLERNILGFDIVARYVEAIEAEMDGFSSVASVIFRFSRPMKFETLVAGKKDADTMVLVDITPGSPDYGAHMPVSWSAIAGQGSGGTYVCDNWVAFRPLWARPLRAGTTYAAILRSGIEAGEGGAFGKDEDFAAVVGAGEPSDKALVAAWKAYAPLRAWAGDSTFADCRTSGAGGASTCRVPADDMISAAVFTTGTPSAEVAKLRDAVLAATSPSVSDLVACGGGAVSPCDDGLSGAEHVRGCVGSDARYTEIHGRFTSPIWQEGTRPYLTPADGGGVAKDGSGKPVSQGTEDVCFAVSVPKAATMPEAGWPLVVFGHGTGGSFRSPMASGFAGEVAEIGVDGQKTGAVVLSFDQVMHGPRRGDTTLGPEELFFNFANPAAAKGNVLQSVADWFRASELARTLTIPASVAGQEVRVDPTRVYFVAHSQGATSAPAFLALLESPTTAILSGAGGGLTLSLLNKTSPVDVASAIGFVLGDVDTSGESRVGEHHPALNLIQLWFDTIEPLNFAPHLFYQPLAGVPPKSVLHVWGNGDTYVPDSTARSLASAMRAVQAEPYTEKIGGTNAEEPPFSKTWAVEGEWVTGAVTDHAPDGDYDGHFVMFRNPDAIRQARQFIGTAITDGLPTVVP